MEDLPEQRGESVWDSSLSASPAWQRSFTPEEVSALHAAALAVCAATPAGAPELCLAAVEAAAAGLPPPILAGLHALRDGALLCGCGFALLRGLPVEAWGDRLAAAAFLVLTRALGALRKQNAAGHVLGHVTDLGLSSSDPTVRVYQTHERQTFHTDSCDVVGLLMLRPARVGGESFLVSAGAVFNALRAASPHLLRALLQPLATDRRGEVPPGALPYFMLPVFTLHEGALSVIYQRQYIDSAARFEGVRIDATTAAALDAFDALCNSPALQVRMTLAPGDVQLVHNHALLHDRSAFEDHEEAARRRHLLRAWVAPAPPAPVRALPEAFAQRFGSVVPGQRGGWAWRGWRPWRAGWRRRAQQLQLQHCSSEAALGVVSPV